VKCRQGDITTNLIGKPDVVRTFRKIFFLFFVAISAFEEKDQSIDRFPGGSLAKAEEASGFRYGKNARTLSSRATISWTLTCLMPYSRKMKLKRAYSRGENWSALQILSTRKWILTGSLSNSHQPFQAFRSSSVRGFKTSSRGSDLFTLSLFLVPSASAGVWSSSLSS